LSTQKQPGTIYFVEEKDLLGFPTPNYVKIGLVKENEKGRSSIDRRDEHQTGNPRPLIVVDSLETNANVSTLETMIHQALAMFRHRGEWFVKPNGKLKPFLEKANSLENIVQTKIDNLISIDEFSDIEDSGIEIDPSEEIINLHKELTCINEQIKTLDEEKKIIELTFRNFGGAKAKEIDGICSYKYKKGSQRLLTKRFQEDHPELFEKYSRDSITSNFTIKKQPTFIKKKLRSELEENLKLQVNNGNYEVIENNDETKTLHHQWLSIMVAKQPLEIKKESLITELKLECGENKGIKNICSWSRKKSKKLSKSDLKNLKQDFLEKYLETTKDSFSFVVNPFRPYTF